MFSNRYSLWVLRPFTPFLLALGGITTDFLTTHVGLSLGLHEAHPNYHPIYSCMIFFTLLYLLTKLLPQQKSWKRCIMGVALLSYFGPVHNILVLAGIFPGLVIS
jgi:hypothetical protein